MSEVSSSPEKKPILWMLAAVVLAVVLLFGIVLMREANGGADAVLPEVEFAEAPRNFSGNRYEYNGRIDRLLGFEEGVGRVILTSSTNAERPVPLFVPVGLERFSPNPGQVFRFGLRVDGDGVLHVESYEKL
ncbi:MAG: hypothetical protein ACON39_07275 [Coraliomargaritaceae bacterium]